MSERVLSPEEVASLGLDKPAPKKKERALTPAEVGELGLSAPAPEPTPERVPSPTGWREPGERKFSDTQRRLEKQDEAMWGALASGAHGAANAMEGPVNGAIEGLKTSALGGQTWDDIVKAYRGKRDDVEKSQAENLKRFPNAPITGALLTNPGSAPTALGRLGMGLGQGALYGLGSSKADVTKGEIADAAADTGKGALIGLGAAGVGELAQLPGRAMAKRAQTIGNATHAADLAAEQEARAAAVASAAGKEGNLTARSMKAWDRLEDAMFNPAAAEETKAWARKFISSEDGKALYNQVLKNYADEAPALLGKLQGAKAAKAAAESANKPELIEAAAEASANAKLMDPKGVTSRLAEIFRRNAYPAVGAAVAGPAGGAAGAMIAAQQGKQGTILSNMLKSPSMFLPLQAGASLGVGAGNAMSRGAPAAAEGAGLLGEREPDALDEYLRDLAGRTDWKDFAKEKK